MGSYIYINLNALWNINLVLGLDVGIKNTKMCVVLLCVRPCQYLLLCARLWFLCCAWTESFIVFSEGTFGLGTVPGTAIASFNFDAENGKIYNILAMQPIYSRLTLSLAIAASLSVH